MNRKYIAGFDQSTQGTKANLVDSGGEIAAKAFLPHEQIIKSTIPNMRVYLPSD